LGRKRDARNQKPNRRDQRAGIFVARGIPARMIELPAANLYFDGPTSDDAIHFRAWANRMSVSVGAIGAQQVGCKLIVVHGGIDCFHCSR